MSGAKSSLKAAKAALDSHDFAKAAELSKKALEHDPRNYHAQIFLGRALDKQSHDDASREAYRAAVSIRKDDVLAWQGLVALFEKQAGKYLDEYHDAVIRLAELYVELDDKIKCQTVIDNYISHVKKYGSRYQYRHALETLLPESTVYEYLEGQIPQPEYTFSIIAEILENEEKEKINSEIGQRRTRLGARIEQVTLEVKREVLGKSPLERIYSEIVDWTHDDERRRLYEEKQLQHAGETLAVLPISSKANKRKEVMKLAQGLVILKHPFLLAWRIVIEWNDVEDLGKLDSNILRDFVVFFPEDGLAKVIKGFLGSEISPFSKSPSKSNTEEDETEAEAEATIGAEERLILMTEGLRDASQSMLAHRLMGQYYLHLDEYESAVSTSKAGLARVACESQMIGLNLKDMEDCISLTLATALIQYQSPRHHTEARGIFERILRNKPDDTSALLGIGMVFEEQEEYQEALDFLQRALQSSQEAKIKAETAWCKALLGEHESALQGLRQSLAGMDGSDAKSRTLRSQTLYRIGICLWSLDTTRSGRKDRKGAYAQFLASLQADMNYAPSYTSLGIYYADYARDQKRATKCFHKAFELSAAEVEAAFRLAQSFAVSSEWDLVEVVAQRVIESGKVKPPPGSKKKPISWPFAALGVVQLNNLEYAKSIVSFQSALRNAPNEYHCWVGLGESYQYSGRHIAATRAFEHAQGLEGAAHSESRWFTEYMLANVKRELGEYDEAVLAYQHVLDSRPQEFGVCIAFLQTLTESAWRSIELGFFSKAIDNAVRAIHAAKAIVNVRPDAYNLWKAIGDACSIFGFLPPYESKLPEEVLSSLLNTGSESEAFDVCTKLDHVTKDLLKPGPRDDNLEEYPLQISMIAALLAHKRAIHASAYDIHARAVAWYNLGWTERLAHMQAQSAGAGGHDSGFLKAAIQCFKRAIEFEAGNSEYWNSLGIVTCDVSPKVSQHAFIRSLYLNDKSSKVWTNLGALYLLQNDSILAQEAFTRAQAADPGYARSWLGQGLIAAKSQDRSQAHQLFAHAFEIADSPSTLIKSQHAQAVFDHALSAAPSTSDFLQPLLTLHQLRSLSPRDQSSLHLSSLFAERLGNLDDSEATLESLCSKLEAQYEISESPSTLLRFAQTKADLARLQLAQSNFGAAADNAGTALDISDEDDRDGSYKAIRLSAHMTAGLAFFHLSSMSKALDMFKRALAETDGNPDVVCLLSQVLWARGGAGEREVARDQLLDCIEKSPGHLGAIQLLGCIAILGDDYDTINAVVSDLANLRTDDNLKAKEQAKVIQLLATIADLKPGSQDQYLLKLTETNSSIMLLPSQPHGWSQLAGLSTEELPAELAIQTGTKAVPPRGTLEAQDLCHVYAGTGRPSDAQRAIMVAPFSNDGWESLSRIQDRMDVWLD